MANIPLIQSSILHICFSFSSFNIYPFWGGIFYFLSIGETHESKVRKSWICDTGHKCNLTFVGITPSLTLRHGFIFKVLIFSFIFCPKSGLTWVTWFSWVFCSDLSLNHFLSCSLWCAGFYVGFMSSSYSAWCSGATLRSRWRWCQTEQILLRNLLVLPPSWEGDKLFPPEQTLCSLRLLFQIYLDIFITPSSC